MLAARPDVYYLVPHYEQTEMVLVRLGELTELEELRERIEESWLLTAPDELARERRAR